ncbi:MAG: hypothetical protein EBY28_27975, partial [Betaproteobacteria bacterium]|nr:hypothetical protein [Betaproteobacteria bacterium]
FDGKVPDGNFQGVRAFYDVNGDGKWQAGESWASIDATGRFSLAGFQRVAGGRIVVEAGGKDASGHPLGERYFAGGAATDGVVSTISTVLALTPGLTQAGLKATLGITDANVDLLHFDYTAALKTGSLTGQQAFAGNSKLYSALDALATAAGDGDAAFIKVATSLGKTLADATPSGQSATQKFALDLHHSLAHPLAAGVFSLNELVGSVLKVLVTEGLVAPAVATAMLTQITVVLKSIEVACEHLAQTYTDLQSTDPVVVAAAQVALVRAEATAFTQEFVSTLSTELNKAVEKAIAPPEPSGVSSYA